MMNSHAYQEPTPQALEKVRNILRSASQEQLLNNWEQWNAPQKKHFLNQILQIPLQTLKEQQTLVREKQQLATNGWEPLTPSELFHYASLDPSIAQQGLQLLQQGKCACIIVAGGQGTRLGFQGPKGTFPLTAIKKKSLFQLIAERTLAASKIADNPLPIAILTSPENHHSTVTFWEKNNCFGLNTAQVAFFSTHTLPLLNDNADLFLQEPGKLACGPPGNGLVFDCFVESKIAEKWRNNGIQYANFIQVDNALADPFDISLLGLHHAHNNAVTIKCTTRPDPQENVGILARKNSHIQVVEYSELPDEQRFAKNADGTLLYPCANTSMFCFSIETLEIAATKTPLFPWHLARKSAQQWDDTKQKTQPIKAWKSEKFVFDILPHLNAVQALSVPRQYSFAPLKNSCGQDSPSTVQQALLNYDQDVFQKITGTQPPPKKAFELHPAFYYPTPELLQKWKGKKLPDAHYITP